MCVIIDSGNSLSPSHYLRPILPIGINFIPSMENNHMTSKVWDEITYPFSNFNGVTVEICEWISNFIPHAMMDVITYPCWDYMLVKGAPEATPTYCQLNELEPTATKRKRKHNDVIKWKHFPRYWPFVRGIHRLPMNPPHKGQWRGALMFSVVCVWISGWVKNREVGDLSRHRAHYDVIVIKVLNFTALWLKARRHVGTNIGWTYTHYQQAETEMWSKSQSYHRKLLSYTFNVSRYNMVLHTARYNDKEKTLVKLCDPSKFCNNLKEKCPRDTESPTCLFIYLFFNLI